MTELDFIRKGEAPPTALVRALTACRDSRAMVVWDAAAGRKLSEHVVKTQVEVRLFVESRDDRHQFRG